jgi:protein associated with RNAse G/E
LDSLPPGGEVEIPLRRGMHTLEMYVPYESGKFGCAEYEFTASSSIEYFTYKMPLFFFQRGKLHHLVQKDYEKEKAKNAYGDEVWEILRSKKPKPEKKKQRRKTKYRIIIAKCTETDGGDKEYETKL